MAYEVHEGKYQSGRSGPKLDAFPCATMAVDHYFDIPLKLNKRGQWVPEKGFNLKAANESFAPKKFIKQRRDDAIRVWRIA
jgi:hypothetical protein